MVAAEEALGFAIPETYRTFLRFTNGGQPIQSHFSERVGVQDFLGLGDVVGHHRTMEGRIPTDMIPIAMAEGGNFILVATSDAKGAIYFWDHELEESGSPLEKLASSFDDFMSRLQTKPVPFRPGPKVISVEVRNPDIFRELLRRDQEMKDGPTVEWPPPR